MNLKLFIDIGMVGLKNRILNKITLLNNYFNHIVNICALCLTNKITFHLLYYHFSQKTPCIIYQATILTP